MAEFTPEQVKAAAAELRDWDGYFLSHGFSTKHVTAPADMLSAYAERLAQTSCETKAVTRFEVIDEDGRVYSNRPCTVELSYQDDGRTLKVFVKRGWQAKETR